MAVRAKKTSAIPADYTPNAVNWADVYYHNDYGTWFYSERQITGINQTITLKVQYTSSFPHQLYYKVSISASSIVTGDASSATSPTSFGMNLVANNGTFTVTNNQYVTFGLITSCYDIPTVTVKNQSDSDATLDTFLIYQAGEC
jgi:hypothetical protein